MTPNKLINLTLLFLVLAGINSEAFARKNDREGFNFGISSRILDEQSSRNPSNDSANTSSSNVSNQALNPYVGWVFAETINIGLSLYIENRESTNKMSSLDNQVSITQIEDKKVLAYSLFSRFLFAKYMYFEGAFGFYKSNSSQETTYSTAQSNGQYNVNVENRDSKGFGLGYNAGGGVEIPITNGFFMSAAFMHRAYSLRDVNEQNAVSTIKNKHSSNELSFGLSHYVN